MPKACRVKVRTKNPRKRQGYCGSKGNKNVDANSDVNSDVNIVNIDVNTAENSVNIIDPPADPNTTMSVNSSVSERKIESIETSTPSSSSRITGNRVIDMEILSSVISMLLCPSCKLGSMKLSEVYAKKKGLASCLLFQCSRCSYFLENHTSRSNDNSFDINTRAVYSMRACGQGYAGLENFLSLMNLPKPMTPNNYDKIVNRLITVTKDAADKTMQDACNELRGDSTTNSTTDTAVSCDGSWQRRGYSSLNGVVTVISMSTGKILDIEAMSRACKACGLKETMRINDPEAYNEWKENHVCKFNYRGTVGNMEPVGAKRIWDRSIEKKQLRYIDFYGDGDCKSFSSIRNTYPDIEVKTLECVGHV